MSDQRFLRMGTISAGATPILANVAFLGSRKSVLLLVDYAMERPGGDGLAGAFVNRPCFAGVQKQPDFPHTIAAGTVVELLQCEADALVLASAASYA